MPKDVELDAELRLRDTRSSHGMQLYLNIDDVLIRDVAPGTEARKGKSKRSETLRESECQLHGIEIRAPKSILFKMIYHCALVVAAHLRSNRLASLFYFVNKRGEHPASLIFFPHPTIRQDQPSGSIFFHK